jgi:hypothetical protein
MLLVLYNYKKLEFSRKKAADKERADLEYLRISKVGTPTRENERLKG